MKQQSLAFRQELFTIGTGDSHTVHEFLDEKVRFHELVQIAFSLYQTCWMPMLRYRSAQALRQPFDRLKVKLSTSLALLRRDAAGTGVTFFARQIQWLAPLGEPSGAYGDGVSLFC